MTKNSARKKAVRARQAVTGEAYNAAARALKRGPAGLTLDDCLANYIDNITSNLVESGVVPDAHEWTGADSEDGPGAYWMFYEDNPSVAPLWGPDGVTVIWVPLRAGWIDHNRVLLPLDDIADVRDAVQALKECVTGRETTTTKDGPRWPLADELENLIMADLQIDDC